MLAEKYPQLSLCGHDQSFYLVNLARERSLSSPSSLTPIPPQFSVGDCRSVPFPDTHFDFVMVMGNSFGYFSANDTCSSLDEFKDTKPTLTLGENDAADRQVLKEINRVLRVGGRMVLDLADGDYMRENFSPRSWEWIDDQTFACRERTLSADKTRLHSREVVVVSNRGVVRDQFYSERLYSRQELVDLLRLAGFDIEIGSPDMPTVDDGVNTVTAARELSQRGQDLGMMEQRLLIIAEKVRQHPLAKVVKSIAISDRATVPASIPVSLLVKPILDTEIITQKPLSPPPFPNGQIAVVMGDPSLSCREKLHGVWNPEDFDTRRKLVQALLDCGYRPDQVCVIENHSELLRTMITNPPSYVFNLCDEGFTNDATKELHVSALFEMCGVAYSGAGPASLAICYDKGLVNATAAKMDIPTPRETYVLLPEALDVNEVTMSVVETLILQKEASGDLQYPAFLKPMKGDNSLGITSRSICSNRIELASYIIALVEQYGFKEFIVQEYLTGTEYSVGMIGNPETGFHFLPILQVDYSKVVTGYGLQPILGWESKWDPESPYWNEIDYVVSPRIKSLCSSSSSKKSPMFSKIYQQEADLRAHGYVTGGLTEQEETDLKQWCSILFERFGLRDYARFDWRADREVFHHPDSGHRCRASSCEDINDDADFLVKSTPSANNATNDNNDASSESSSSINDSARGSIPNSAGTNELSMDDRLVRDDTNSSRSRSADGRATLRHLKLLEVNPNPGWYSILIKILVF